MATGEQPPIRVLYVEDNDDNIYMLSNRLQRKGFEVLIAHNGQEGVDMAANEMPSVIIMDLNMPVMDGWEAIRRIKASGPTQHIPIIALSAHAMTGDHDRAIAAGADDFEAKPLRLPSLLQKIATLLRQ